MTRSPSPDRREERSRHSKDDRERRRSRSPDRRRESRRDEERSSRDDKGKDREREREREDRRSRDDDREHRRERRRSRSRSRSPARRRERSRSRDRHHHSSSRRRSPSSGSSSDGSEDSRDRRHRRKHSSRDKSSRDSKGRDKEERRKRREEKKAKKERKERKKKGLETIEWGKWGILTEADIYTKDTEYRAWLVGERMINPETLSKAKEKDIFKEYMEAFNTGTLPSDKYVDTAKYEARMNAIRGGETVVTSERYDPNKDMESLRAAHRGAPSTAEPTIDRSRLEDLRRAQNERTEMERMKRLGMTPKASMGVIHQTDLEKRMGVK
ncbi:hypothetical protein BCR35DRAFT_304488 [Leucosporidium creatinivorum]|uniref:Uncharacterized protein n=1 Tax=Leucosporidium creatinivorum TaxID=106004 RepID=A0A1Y2F8S7_9BASI|nr:hypothetical protein BCR35DRAFT_304488 [Leucosporidium creatinivorum]